MIDILVVEDVKFDMDLIKRMLEKNTDYNVITAFNGEEALEVLYNRKKIVDLILLDIKMPGMNGFEFIKVIKTDNKFKNIPVIFISSSNNMENRIKSFRKGGVDYISKPFNQLELIERIRVHLKNTVSYEEIEDKLFREKFREKNNVKVKFIENALHDVRNPVSIMDMYSEFLLDETKDTLDKDHYEFIKIINTTSKFTFKLLEDIGTYMELRMETTELEKNNKNYAEFVKDIIKEKIEKDEFYLNIELKTDLDIENLNFNEELINLAIEKIFNIIKYSYLEGNIELNLNKYKDSILTEISYYGKETFNLKDNIFEPFYKLYEGGNYKDTGLSLAIAKEAIIKHNGEIEVKELENGRKVFYFHF